MNEVMIYGQIVDGAIRWLGDENEIRISGVRCSVD